MPFPPLRQGGAASGQYFMDSSQWSSGGIKNMINKHLRFAKFENSH